MMQTNGGRFFTPVIAFKIGESISQDAVVID